MNASAWQQFYQSRHLSQSYTKYFQSKYRPFIEAINNMSIVGDRIVEVGCGIGTVTKILRDVGIFRGYRCYDIDPDMVALTKETLVEGTPNLEFQVPVEIGDARLPIGCKPDIIHSHGMLEHFSDEDIRRVLNAHEEDSPRWAIHYVPGDKYEKPSFGDERLLPLSYWQDMFKPTNSFRFNDGHDYCLMWRY